MKILLRLLGLAWGHPKPLIAAYGCLIATNCFALTIPYLLGNTIDQVLEIGNPQDIVNFCLAILFVAAFRGAFSFGQTYFGEQVSQLVAFDLRNNLYRHLLTLSFSFHDKQQTGNLMSKVTADVEAIRNFVQTGTLRISQTIFLLTGTTVILLITNWRLALISLGFIPIVFWRSTVSSLSLRQLWLHIHNRLGHLTTLLQENLNGVRILRVFGAKQYEISKFQSAAEEIAVSTIKAGRQEALNTSVLALSFAITTGIILWFGGQEVLHGRLSPGEFAKFVFYLGLITGPVRMSGGIISRLSRAASAGQRVYEVLDSFPEIQEKPLARVLPPVTGFIKFENLHFAYNKDLWTLQDISFEARPGEVIALLGAPGSGKSSVVQLISRFYDPTFGRVTIDEIDIRDVTLSSLRTQIGFVMQDVFIFSNTIRNNIAYGKPDATMQEINQVSKIAQLHSFINSLPEGYETFIGERGITLSGGQRQRLAIARTLLIDPPILVLDDSTSSVDAETEDLLQSALTDVMKGRTAFIIAHRLSSVRNADQILILEDGKIIQRGNHTELLKINGPYQNLYHLQLMPEGLLPVSKDSEILPSKRGSN